MSGGDKNLENLLASLMEVKNKHGLDNDSFLVLLGLVNLMGIINLLEGRGPESKKKDGIRRTPAERAPFMGMFAGPRSGGRPVEEDDELKGTGPVP